MPFTFTRAYADLAHVRPTPLDTLILPFIFFFPVSMIKIGKIKVVDLVQSTANNTSQVKNRASLAPDMPALRFSTQLSTPILFKSTWRHVNQAELCPIVNF